jgi:uncharacterized protein YecT (DUF1311 family)
MAWLSLIWAALAAASPEAELAALKASLPAAIDDLSDQGMERDSSLLADWKAQAADLVGAWTAFRDTRCDPRLLAFERRGEGKLACRLRITRTAVADLRLRYGLDDKGFGRANVEESATRPHASAEEEGPCAKAPPLECDYCGMNHCWEARLKADEARLNVAWRSALERIRTRPSLSAATRAEWSERLRESQRAWLRWRDLDCALERQETPNPNAHSIYALVTGPCLASETEARIQHLRRTYGR